MLASPPPEPAERAPQVPTLVILGTHDRVVSNDRTLALVAQWRSSGSTVRVEHFAASGHLPHLEEFERFVDTVRAFLEEDENGTTPTE
jgi:pimeloyl-ACP methyl ester carboxylesterase